MLQIGAALFYYKLEQTLLQIGAASLLHIETSVVTNDKSGSYYKSGNRYYKIGKLLQIGANIIKNWGR